MRLGREIPHLSSLIFRLTALGFLDVFVFAPLLARLCVFVARSRS